MNGHDLEEKVYFDDSKTKVTASFIASYKQIILPIERVKDVIVTHKTYRMYICFLTCLLLILALFGAPFIPVPENFNLPNGLIWYLFTPLFGGCCIWFRFIYENYVELHIQLDDDRKYQLRVITLGKRTIIYDIADAIHEAVGDYHAKSKLENKFQETHSRRLRKLNNMLIESNLDKTPELMEIFKIDHNKK
ncbi:MAG: hypothetical protein IKB16_00225 [Lentisphaeria bacterium]|nr:hypothetical protein [Lentisphaeria bacterium]